MTATLAGVPLEADEGLARLLHALVRENLRRVLRSRDVEGNRRAARVIHDALPEFGFVLPVEEPPFAGTGGEFDPGQKVVLRVQKKAAGKAAGPSHLTGSSPDLAQNLSQHTQPITPFEDANGPEEEGTPRRRITAEQTMRNEIVQCTYTIPIGIDKTSSLWIGICILFAK